MARTVSLFFAGFVSPVSIQPRRRVLSTIDKYVHRETSSCWTHTLFARNPTSRGFLFTLARPSPTSSWRLFAIAPANTTLHEAGGSCAVISDLTRDDSATIETKNDIYHRSPMSRSIVMTRHPGHHTWNASGSEAARAWRDA